MRIHLLSDLHFEFQPWRRSWPIVDADVHVLAGDIGFGLEGVKWALDHFSKPVLYVMGNHEHYGRRPMTELLLAARQRTEGTHVTILENDSIVIDGVRFLGCTLWTDFRLFGEARRNGVMATTSEQMSDYANIHVHKKGGRPSPFSIYASGSSARSGDRLTPLMSSELHADSVRFLQRELARTPDPAMVAEPWDRTVVVTHHAPSTLSLQREAPHHEIDAAYASQLDTLVVQADLWLHGHVHAAREYRLAVPPRSTRVVMNCRGYADHGIDAVAEFCPDRVIDI